MRLLIKLFEKNNLVTTFSVEHVFHSSLATFADQFFKSWLIRASGFNGIFIRLTP